MSLILVPQVSGSVLPANVHQRVVYKKTATFHYILSIVSDLGQHRAPASISKRQPCACPARHGQHSSAHRAEHLRPFPLDRLGVEQRARRLRRFKLG
jgi:hypothetical protein